MASEADMEADIDRGEIPAAMEPMLVGSTSPHRPALHDLALELAIRSERFKERLPDGIRLPLADLVRSMNCYYSNLIEGHKAHPIDIERALRGDYSSDRRARDLQLEARAHIEVQRWIDAGGVRGRAVSVEAIAEIHRRFCDLLPPTSSGSMIPPRDVANRYIPAVSVSAT